jgi:hypothetical protein
VDTFVVRVASVDDDVESLSGRGLLRGVVSRVASGQTVTFQSADELVAFLVDPRGGRIDEEASHEPGGGATISDA